MQALQATNSIGLTTACRQHTPAMTRENFLTAPAAAALQAAPQPCMPTTSAIMNDAEVNALQQAGSPSVYLQQQSASCMASCCEVQRVTAPAAQPEQQLASFQAIDHHDHVLQPPPPHARSQQQTTQTCTQQPDAPATITLHPDTPAALNSVPATSGQSSSAGHQHVPVTGSAPASSPPSPSTSPAAPQPDDIVSDAALRYVAAFCALAHASMAQGDAVALAAAIPPDPRLGLVGEVHARCRAGLELLHVVRSVASLATHYRRGCCGTTFLLLIHAG